MEPKRALHSGNLVRGICAEVASKEESFQILKVEDKEENFSFMETMGKENHNSAGL